MCFLLFTDQQISIIGRLSRNSVDIFFFRTNVVLNYTEIEAKVREATNDEAWGPTGKTTEDFLLFTSVCILFFWGATVFYPTV